MLWAFILLAAVGLFALGLFWPGHSRRTQRWIQDHARRVERWAQDRPQPLRWVVRSPFWTARKVADIATRKGRSGHHQVKQVEREVEERVKPR